MMRSRTYAMVCATSVWAMAASAAPGVINYQGRLTDTSGNPITTAVTVTFTFWDDEAAGTQLSSGFSDADTVTPDADGIYSTEIGDDPGNLVPESVFDGDSVWLNVNVGGENLTPRLRVTSVGFAIHASHADDAAALEGLQAEDFLPMFGDAYVIVKTTSSWMQNGTNLLTAYAVAQSLTPGGFPLSADNRATVIVPPGIYYLASVSLTLDTDFVDLIGLTAAPGNQLIRSDHLVLRQTARDVHIGNLAFQNYAIGQSLHAYYPEVTFLDGVTTRTGSPPETTIRNCDFRVSPFDLDQESTRTGPITYAGTYVDCVAEGLNTFAGDHGIASGTFTNCSGGDYSFGGLSGTASGTFTNCTGGNYAFGGYYGTASGTFIRCTGGQRAFGGTGGTASGTFTNCTGDYSSFAGREGGTASGVFTNCSGGDYSFGGNATASGTFMECAGGDASFGGAEGAGSGTASGTFTNCTGGFRAFGGGTVTTADGGEFYHCVGGASAFTETGTPAPVQLFCIQDGVQYPGND